MRVKRRMGPETAETRTILMDAVEGVLREQGYAALSARTVAAHAGLKYQIVFYYFETMDELLIATYRRLMHNMSAVLDQALESERPLHALWEIWSHPSNGAVWLEFMTIANHNHIIRAEKIAYADQMREVMVGKLSKRFDEGPGGVFTPFAVSTVLACIGGIMAFESALGMADTHDETRKLVAWSLEELEPMKTAAKKTGSKKADAKKAVTKKAATNAAPSTRSRRGRAQA